MGYRVDAYNTLFGGGASYGPQDMALDCRDPIGTNMCDFDDYSGNGYSRWPFFEYLTEKYGVAFVQDVFARGAAGAALAPNFTALNAVSDALVAQGTTVADTYNAWTQADLIGAYSISALQNRQPPFYVNWQTGLGGDLGKVLVSVNHLSTRTVEFTRGDGDATHLCYAAHLAPTVGIPCRHAVEARLLVERIRERAGAADDQRQHRDRLDPLGHLHVRSRERLPDPAECLEWRREGGRRRFLGQGHGLGRLPENDRDPERDRRTRSERRLPLSR